MKFNTTELRGAKMLSIHLIKLIENHAESLTHEVVED